MQLSVIIVNYNVKFYLEQCLYSVRRAMQQLEAELIVVDNHSLDGSREYLTTVFPDVHFIFNEKNLGFAKANNQALKFCKGKYVLFLNPDTLVPEDAFHACVLFLEQHQRAGALGVRMLDGRGHFLPESKRAFPSPLTSLFKLTGLASLFPRSGIFNKYALGNLDEQNNHSVEVLAGAFLMVRKSLLDELGGFDESYFLYGEDIDLSYRIRKAGYENIYFAGTTIIHFKGESSAGYSFERINFFYRAMLVFVQKHYLPGAGFFYSSLIRVAIIVRGLFAAMKRIVRPFILPMADTLLVFLSLQAMRFCWIIFVRNGNDFGVSFVNTAISLAALLFILTAAATGLYDRWHKISKTISSLAFAVLCALAAYSLLPEQLRFSRGVILGGSVLGAVTILLLRIIWPAQKRKPADPDTLNKKQMMIAGSADEYRQVINLLEQALVPGNVLGRIAPENDGDGAIGHLYETKKLLQQPRLTEIIYCIGKIPLKKIIRQLEQLSKTKAGFLFHYAGSRSLVGSDTQDANNKTFATLISYRLADPAQLRIKRLTDIFLSVFFLLSFPVHLMLHRSSRHFLQNALSVLMARKSWVGYASEAKDLPPIKKAVITHLGAKPLLTETALVTADSLYAKNYDWWMDMTIVFQCYQKLGF